MKSDAPGAAGAGGMLKSYKKVSRWYPALEPAPEGTAPDQAQDDSVLDSAMLDNEGGPARFPHYIREDEPELDIPPVPESVLRRSHFSGSWSDWMRDRESGSHAPRLRYRAPAGEPATVVEFPWDGEEDEPRPARDRSKGRGNPEDRSDTESRAQTRTSENDPASALLDAVDDAPEPRDASTARRAFAIAFLIVAILLLAAAGGVALYVLNSHSGTSQSIGTRAGDAGSGSSAGPAAYNEMTAIAGIGDHGPAASVPAG
ncbi:hypothetical protein AB0N05_10020 [Nocardia sp. NPDC051030]|uniref:hypothetical protein n=1 Tax=Nocardia sp. NPDC051030 TaxID=3155162 RepID=UPI00342F6031